MPAPATPTAVADRLGTPACLLDAHGLQHYANARTAGQQKAMLKARFSTRVEQPNSRYSIHRTTTANTTDSSASSCSSKYSKALSPTQQAVAARLAAAAAWQQQRQQKQQLGKPGSRPLQHQLSRDIHAVCEELGLPRAAAEALVTAAAKRQVSLNPGVLLSQLARLLTVEEHIGGPGSLGNIISSFPQLVLQDPQTVISNLAAAQSLLGPSCSVSSLVHRYPQLLTCSPFRMETNLGKLQELLQFSSRAAATAAAVRKPPLLLSSPSSLQLRMQQLQQLMTAVSENKLKGQLRKHPELLLLRTSTIASKLKCLELLFAATQTASVGTAADEAAAARRASIGTGATADAVVAEQPATHRQQSALAALQLQQHADLLQQQQQPQPCLPVHQSSVQQQCSERLQQLSMQRQQSGQQWHGQWQQKTVLQPQHRHAAIQRPHNAFRLAAAAAASQWQLREQQQQQQLVGAATTGVAARFLGRCSIASTVQQWHISPSSTGSSACDSRVQLLVLKVPALLSLNPATLQHHIMELQLLLGLQSNDLQLQRIVQLQPGLLTQSPATLANKLQVLRYLTGRTEAVMQEMVVKCPAVLTLSVANVTAKWELLCSGTAHCDVWQKQLRKLPPVTLGMMLCYKQDRLRRLKYVVALHAAGQQQCSNAGSTGNCVTSRFATSSSSNISNWQSQHTGCSSKLRKHSSKGSLSMFSSIHHPQRQQHSLSAVPWKSIVQQSEQAFTKRYPGYANWSSMAC